MSIEKLLQRHQSNSPADTSDPDGIEDQGAYGLVRAQRERALMLELRKKDGDIVAIPYAVIEQMRFGPTDGIVIHVGGRDIRIAGRNLNTSAGAKISLFSGLCRHRVAWVQEQSRTDLNPAISATNTRVEGIEW